MRVTKNEETKVVIYETTVHNCDGCLDLAVAASSPKEAADLFVADLESEKWKKIADDELREALDDWKSLSDDERRDKPTLPYYIYGWIVEVNGKRYRTPKPIIDAHIRIWEENSNIPYLGRHHIERHHIEQDRTVQILGGSGNLVRYYRRYDFNSLD